MGDSSCFHDIKHNQQRSGIFQNEGLFVLTRGLIASARATTAVRAAAAALGPRPAAAQLAGPQVAQLCRADRTLVPRQAEPVPDLQGAEVDHEHAGRAGAHRQDEQGRADAHGELDAGAARRPESGRPEADSAGGRAAGGRGAAARCAHSSLHSSVADPWHFWVWIRIRISGSMPLTNGSVSFYFHN